MHEQKLCCSRGTGLAILCNFINHSCVPNVARCFTNDNRIMIFANQYIKKYSQVIYILFSKDVFWFKLNFEFYFY